MTKDQAQRVASQALPCPFCGEQLVVQQDHHGFWVAHRQEPGPCIDSTTQLLHEDDLARWNTRPTPKGVKYFLAYAYKLKGIADKIHFGSSVVDSDEHPVARVARWNREYDYKQFILLSYQELPGDFPHELDTEF